MMLRVPEQKSLSTFDFNTNRNPLIPARFAENGVQKYALDRPKASSVRKF
jgi:hypothetical protein